jgi:cobalt-zinc-cadmium resistance protein CzcA
MLSAIIRFSIRNKLVIGLLVLALIGTGIYDFARLPIDAVPDITNNQVQVITVSPSMAAPEIERLVTFPIEQATAGIPGIKELRSFSRFGLSLITIVFNDDIDVYWARQQVNERITRVKDIIPGGIARPELAPVTTGLGEIFQYAVKAKKGYEGKYGAMELRTIQDWIIRRQLLGTEGVADVSSFGGYLKQYEVAVIPDKLKSLNVSINDIFGALQLNNQNTGGAYIEKGPNLLYIRSEGLAKTSEEIGKTFVKHTPKGIPVYIKDVAEVQIGHAIRYGAMCYNNEGEVAGAVVMMLKGENSSKVIKAVKERIRLIEKTLPEGVVIEPFLDRTKMVNNAIGTVKTNLLEGAVIVIFILVLFLGNLRAGWIVASVIPLSMLFAVIMMNLFGVSGNLMSLGALDFGLIVDGAVIIVEAVMHRLYHSKQFSAVSRITQETMDHEVGAVAGKMMNTAIFGQIIILIVYLPILTLVGIEGKMFKPMAQTVSFALIGAFILSLTYIPMISALVLKKKLYHGETWADKIMRFLQSIYQPALKFALRFPKTIVISSLLVFGFSLWILTRLGGEFIPELEEGDFAVDTRVLTGSSLTTTIKSTQQTADILLKRFPEVEKIVTKIGSGEIPTDPMPVEASDMMVILKDKSEWVSASSFDELADTMSKVLATVPGVTAGFQFPVQMRFNELMTGARQDVVCKIFGEDLDSLDTYAHRLGNIIKTVEGATDLYIETVTGLPQIVIRYDRDAMARYQLNIADVNQVVQTAFAGQSAGMIYENERRFDLVVRLKQSQRTSVDDVQYLLINTPAGIQVPLYQVASVSVTEGPNQIQREDAKRRIVVGFNVRGRDVQSIVTELEAKVNSQVKFPAGYYITYGGQFQNLVEAKERLSIAVPVALLLIFIMLYFAFAKFSYSLLIFSAIPLSAIGGILALWARGMPFSISAGIGFIALFGVAVLNGIVLIAEFNRLKKQGIHDINQIVMEGTKVRLRPVLMTASVASLGFLPMALSSGAGAEVQRPLATVVIGGLGTATLLTLLLLPVLYRWLEKRGGRKSLAKESTVTLTLLIMLSAFPSAQAQQAQGSAQPLDSFLSKAVARNRALSLNKIESQYWKQLSSRVVDLPASQIGAEYGNINSAFNDTRFSVMQSFNMPVVYRRQKQVYEAQYNTGRAWEQVKENELRRQVKLLFYQMVDILERRKLLNQLDSVFKRSMEAAALRFKTGDINLLEKTNVETQWQQLQLQGKMIETDLVNLQKQLQWLLNTNELLIPYYSSAKKNLSVLMDSQSVATHPILEYERKLLEGVMAQTSIEKSRLAPQVSIGYSNLSINGWQSPDGITQKYYGSSDRFHTTNLGMSLPLFNRGTKNRIKAASLLEEKARQQVAITDMELRNQLERWTEQYKLQREQLSYYEQFGLSQSDLIIKQAGLAYAKGETSYQDWTISMNNAVHIRSAYLDALKRLNETIIEIEYLTGK